MCRKYIPANGMVPPTVREDLSSSIKHLWKLPHRHAQWGCALGDYKSGQVDTEKSKPRIKEAEHSF